MGLRGGEGGRGRRKERGERVNAALKDHVFDIFTFPPRVRSARSLVLGRHSTPYRVSLRGFLMLDAAAPKTPEK